ncbi:MAG: hypothetical protein ACSW8G_08520, partial [Bacillota bacterium]
AIGKCYTITSVTDKIESITDSIYKPDKEGEKEDKTRSDSVLHDFKIARGAEEESDCSYVVLYYDCKDTTKLLFVQVYLPCLSDFTYTKNGKETPEYKNSAKTYFMQLRVE